ncbi:MAG: S8 family serine peptidase, partial [Planctomycetota bacterium]|nr:S8 family serine peptidase [Planctomycetota bacterium]
IRGSMSHAKMDRLRAIGMILLDVHTYQSVIAKIPAKALPQLANFDFVHWVGYPRPQQKIDNILPAFLDAADSQERLPIVVSLYEPDIGPNTEVVVDGERKTHPEWAEVDVEESPSTKIIPNGRFQKGLEALGFEFEHYNEIIHALHGQATKAQILEMLKLDWVRTMEMDLGEPELDHDQGIAMVRQDYVRKTYGGKGVAAGFIDSGIDASPWHKDFYNKFFVAFNGAFTPTSDHGTHVAGTIWGNGSARSDKLYQGAAPLAGTGGGTNRLFVGNSSIAKSTNASSFGKNYKDSNNKTSPYPRIISNSYSSKTTNGWSGTESDARTIDNAIFNKRQLWVFSAGNKKSTPANFWVGSPSSAKNVLTVSNHEDNFNSSRTINPGQRWNTSRWGVTDSRTKPEVGAPGHNLTSTAWNSTTGYSTKSGTSMSTPLVSGCLISRIEADSWYKDKPEALKARAVASAKNDNSTGSGVWTEPQTGKGTKQTTGWGMINTRTMIYKSAETEAFTWGGGTYTAKNQNWSGSFLMPTNAHTVRIVLAYSETSASSLATKARRNDIRGYLDCPPFTSSNSTGDYSVASSLQNVIVRNITVPSSAKGKTCKIKTYSHAHTLLDKPRWSVVVQIYKKNPTVKPTVTATGASIVKPSVAYDLTGAMRSPTGYDQFQSGRLYYSGGFSSTGMSRKTDDGLTQSYTSANSHPSSPSPSVGKGGNTGMTIGMGTYRPLTFKLKAPSTSGTYALKVYGTYGTTLSPAPLVSATKSVCVDGLAPKAISGLSSTTHTSGGWSNKKTITLKWTKPTDSGCAGIYGMAWNLGKSATSTPTVIDKVGAATSATFSNALTSTSTGYYFHVRSQDKAKNYGSVAKVGPFKIDTTAPTMGAVSINKGATYTSSIVGSVTASASDTYSGAKYMQYSMNGSTWSGLYTYTTAARNVNLSSFGGNTNEGTKTVRVRVRDAAGNYSTVRSDSITYMRLPKITGGTVTSLPNVTSSYYRLTGTDFNGTNKVTFGGASLAKWASANDDWWTGGAYRYVSDTVMYIYPPQGKASGSYGVKFSNTVGSGNTFNVTVTKTSTKTLRSNSRPTAGKKVTISMAQAGMSSGTRALFVMSALGTPSVLPGTLSLEIGGNWASIVNTPLLPFNSAGVLSLKVGTLPAWKGLSLYFEGVYGTLSSLPLPTTNKWKTTLQ